MRLPRIFSKKTKESSPGDIPGLAMWFDPSLGHDFVSWYNRELARRVDIRIKDIVIEEAENLQKEILPNFDRFISKNEPKEN